MKANYKKITSLFLACLIAASLFSCKKSASEDNQDSDSGSDTDTTLDLPDVDFKTEATAGESVSCDTNITFNGTQITIDGKGAAYEGTTVTISSAGVYQLSGTLSGGQVIVNTEDDEDVTLCLNGASITCSNAPAVYVVSAPKKVVLSLASGSVNIVTDGKSYSANGEEDPDAAIYSKEDLKIEGSGALYVTGSYAKGICSKDDLTIESGNVYVTSVDDSIRGRDSVEVTGGYISVTSSADGISSSNDTDEGKGYITVSGGEIYIKAAEDGIQAAADLNITEGIVGIETGNGADANTTVHNDNMGGGGGPGGGGPGGNKRFSIDGSTETVSYTEGTYTADTTDTTSETTETSMKGLKAAGILTVSGGDISLDCNDDSLHSDDTMYIKGGTLNLASGDDGLHAEKTLEISNGSLTIAKSYEGVEAANITVSGGNVSLISSDDGFNASDGSSTGGMGGFGRGGGQVTASNALLSFTGGYVFVNAAGDGIDSNGNIIMSGGSVIVFGPTNNGNGAIDFGEGGSFKLTGGYLLAAGSSGMAETAEGSGQEVIQFNIDSVNKDTLLYLLDSDGNCVLAFKAPKTFENVVFSSSSLENGEKYSVYTGGNCSGKLTDNVYQESTNPSGGNLEKSLTL